MAGNGKNIMESMATLYAADQKPKSKKKNPKDDVPDVDPSKAAEFEKAFNPPDPIGDKVRSFFGVK